MRFIVEVEINVPGDNADTDSALAWAAGVLDTACGKPGHYVPTRHDKGLTWVAPVEASSHPYRPRVLGARRA